MSQILNRVRDVDPNDSEAVKEALTPFFHNLSRLKDIDSNRWLRTLENVINRFPKYCSQHRATIENYLVHFLHSNNYYHVIEAAKCAHAVQQVRKQQDKTASAKSCWRDQMSTLCEAAHTLIDALFTKSASFYNKNRKTQKNEQQSLNSPLQTALMDIEVIAKPEDIVNKSAVLCTRLRNVLVFIQAMLVEIYPVAKPVRPQLILEVILQALSASGNEDSTKVTTIKVQALRTLDAIVACLGSNLVPFSALAFRFVMQTLRWSSEHISEDTRVVRCSAYNSLTAWLSTLRAHRQASAARAWDDQLAEHVARDLTPAVHLVELTANAQPMKNLSKKARKKHANSMLMQSKIYAHRPGEKNKTIIAGELNDDVAIAAIECSESYLTVCGIFLKPTTHKQYQELLVRECYNIDSYRPERGIWMLRALEACRKSCSPKVPPPTQHCLQLYSMLVNNAVPEISKFCSQALLDIRLHLHCSPPSLNYVLEDQAEKKQRDDKRKRVSDRNRAMLESLLGQERTPSEDLAEEDVITIPDEPASKKPRTEEEISDKISLSSESAVSVETSDDTSIAEVEEIEQESSLDDSNGTTDYIIEPNIEINTGFELAQETEKQSNLGDTEEIDKQNDEANDEPNEHINDNLDDDINNADTQKITQADKTYHPQNIFEVITQMPIHVSNDTIEAEKSPPLSLEVAYDYPNTGQDKVTVLEKMDEDNLPSTNETDDVQITCGQTVKSSQDAVDSEVKEPETNESPKENGITKSPERIVENGDATNAEIGGESAVASKIAPNDGAVTVEDMLADFVDEVNESQIQA